MIGTRFAGLRRRWVRPGSAGAQHIKAGRLHPLAHWSIGRLAEYPELPSFKELGLDIEFNSWAAFFVPAASHVRRF